MKQKFKFIQQIVFLLIAGLLLVPFSLEAQQVGRKYPREVLSSRIIKFSKDYKTNIIYNPGKNDVTVPELVTSDNDVKKVLGETLVSTGYTFIVMFDKSIVVKKEKEVPQPQQKPKDKGTLSGTILDESGETLVGATVMVVGTTIGITTDMNGHYILKQVPAGTHTVEVRYISYQTQQVEKVKVTGGKTTRLDLVLKPASESIEEVVVKADYKQASAEGLYARQQNAIKMVDGISADLIKKTSDNNVAQVLKRVSGVTIDKGKYVTVRGMSERYNNVQLNGANLPSTEPNRRNFSFNVIPAALVDNVTISKTFTPDMPGEFVGGLVEVSTLAVPKEKFISLSVGTGMNTNSTGKDFYSNKRYGKDWWTGEVDSRKWYTGKTAEATQQNIINAGNINTYGLRKYTAMPTQNYGITAGYPFNLKKAGKLGVVLAFTYRHDEKTESIKEAHMITRDSIFSPAGQGSYRYKSSTAVGAVANIGWEMPGHKITWHNLYNNRFSHTNQERYIFKAYESFRLAEQYSSPLVSTLWQTQLDGEHKFFHDHLMLSWNTSYNKITRTNPDDRHVTGSVEGESPDNTVFVNWGWTTGLGNRLDVGSGHIMYSNLEENKKNAGFNLEYNFNVAGNPQKLKAGYLGNFREAEFGQQYLKPLKEGDSDISFNHLPLDELYAPEHFGGNPLQYEISGMEGDCADYYNGTQNIHAGYLLGEFCCFKKVRIIGGFRAEKTDMKVTTEIWNRESQESERDSTVQENYTNWLPAASLIYNIIPELNLRASYSKTLARPDFRELSLATYYNVDDRVWIINAEPIKVTTVQNYDVRMEWYPRPGEVFSLSYFYKKFRNPVERLMRMQQDHTSFNLLSVNLDESTAKGLELNLRKSLGFIAISADFLNKLYVTGNYTWMKANVSYNTQTLASSDPTVTSDPEYDRNRPLQGLSPYTLNLGMAYEGEFWGISVNHNRSGRKLIVAGDYEKYDQYEKTRDVLDVQLSARFLQQKLEVKFNAGDLLNQDVIIYRNCGYEPGQDDENDKSYADRTCLGKDYNDGDWVMSRIKKGVNLSLSVSYKF